MSFQVAIKLVILPMFEQNVAMLLYVCYTCCIKQAQLSKERGKTMASQIKEINGERYLNMEACAEYFHISPQGWRNRCRIYHIQKWKFGSSGRSVFVKESDLAIIDIPVEK